MSRGKAAKGGGILAVILCIPLAFIVYFWISYSSQSISLSSVRGVTLVTPSGESVLESRSDVDFFVSLSLDAQSISTAMRDVSGEQAVEIIYDRGDKPITYRLYPSLNLSGCLLVGPETDGKSKLYVLDTDQAKQLLLRSEFEYLYSSQFLPVLTVSTGNERTEVAPVECDWKYIKPDGNVYSYTPASLAAGDEVYTVYKGLENHLSFSPDNETKPYTLSDVMFVSESGVQYRIDDISELDLSVDTLVNVSFTAKWSNLNGAQSYGEASYKFRILYDIPAVLSASAETLRIGDILRIDAKHLNADESVKLNTALDTIPLRFFVTSEDNGFALLPIGINSPLGATTLGLTTNGGTSTYPLTLESLSGSGAWDPISITEEQFQSSMSKTHLEAYLAAVEAVVSEQPDENYFTYGSDKFAYPTGSKNAKYGFGRRVNLSSPNILNDTGERTIEAEVYELAEGAEVRASQKGKVVFADTLAATGNTVIIYHGYGIYSHYYNLDTVGVSVGDVVESAKPIGTAGKTGFTADKTVLTFAVSVGDVFVNPAALR